MLTEQQRENRDRREEAWVLLDLAKECVVDNMGAIELPKVFQCPGRYYRSDRVPASSVLRRIVQRIPRTRGKFISWNRMIEAVTGVDLRCAHFVSSPKKMEAIKTLSNFYEKVTATEEEALQWLLDQQSGRWPSTNSLTCAITKDLGPGPGNEAWCWLQIEAGDYVTRHAAGDVTLRVDSVQRRLDEVRGKLSPLATMKQDILPRDDEVPALNWLLIHKETSFVDYADVLNQWAEGTGINRGKLVYFDKCFDDLGER